MERGGTGFSEHLPSHLPPFQPTCLVCAEKWLWIWGTGRLRNPKLPEGKGKSTSPVSQANARAQWDRLGGQPALARDSPASRQSPRGDRVTLTRGDIAQGPTDNRSEADQRQA